MTDTARDPRVTNLVGLAIDAKPVEFQTAFNDIVTDRIAQAVGARKIEIASTIFDPPQETAGDEVTVDNEEESNGEVT